VATAAIAGATVQSLVASVRRHAYELEQRDRERTRLLARLQTLAQTDPLTGLPNRRAWDAQLERELADRREREFCVAALDLDDFKKLNDREGHAAGDPAGVAHRREGESGSDLQARADALLYSAKRTGRARTASAAA
jgi:GGDEF domain-containing protein